MMNKSSPCRFSAFVSAFYSSLLSGFSLKLALGVVGYAILSHMLATPIAFAQKQVEEKPYALLFVTVWGPDNHAVSGIKVRIRRADQKKSHWELISDRRGELAQRLPPGPADYVVYADLKGVKDMSGKALRAADEINVHFDKDERVDIGLHLK